jgi:hypothetical protein
LLLIGAGLVSAPAQQDFSKVQIKATKVAGGVYMLEGSGGNIGVSVGEDGIVIVDDQFAPLAPKIKAALKEITDKPVRFVLNTPFTGTIPAATLSSEPRRPLLPMRTSASACNRAVPSGAAPSPRRPKKRCPS